MDTGKIINQLRKQYFMTQEQLGEKLGVSKNLICMFEKGKRTPGRDAVLKMADLFGVSADYIYGRTDTQNEKYLSLMEDQQSFSFTPIVPKYETPLSFRNDQPDSYASEKDLLAVIRTDRMIYVRIGAKQWALVDRNKKSGKHICVISGEDIIIKKKKELSDNDEIIGEAVSIITIL